MNKIILILIIIILIIIYNICDNIDYFVDLESLNLEQGGVLNINKNKDQNFKGTFSLDPDIISNPENSITFIKNFTKNISVYRPVGSKELANVKTMVINEMKKIGLDTQVQSFTRTINNKKYSFSNLIGKNTNVHEKFITIGVHIDSPQIEGCESTLDAATGISIALELARKILSKDPLYPIMLVFFDGEEAIDGPWNSDNSLSGSRYFVNNYDLSFIERVYIFDLIGGDFNKNKIAGFANNPVTHYDIEKLAEINEKYDNQIFINPSKYISTKTIEDDHVPFSEKNKYSLNLIPYTFPDSHHTLKDNYNNVNWKYVETFYKVFYEFLDTIDY
jgi:hypothetical protein